jgi:Ca2+-binding RTX toxin-like protein
MPFTQQELKDNLFFPKINDIPQELIDTLKAQEIEIKETLFTPSQQEIIKGYIDFLYASPTAKEIFNQATGSIAVIPTTGFWGIKEIFPSVMLDMDIIDGTTKLGYISTTGKYVKVDPRLGFMHEMIHAITGKLDPINVPNNNKVYSSSANSLGDTQTIANKIQAELGFPLQVTYDSILKLHESGVAAPPGGLSIEEGTEFTKNKIVGAANNNIDIGTFVIDETYLGYGFTPLGKMDTSDDGQTTDDLFIQKQIPGRAISKIELLTGAGNDYLYGSDGNDTLVAGSDNDYLNGGRGNDSLDGGMGEDQAEFTDKFENYVIETTGTTNKTTTITHKNNGADGVDTIKDIEWGIFNGEQTPVGNARLASASSSTSAPRIIPLPLEDGELDTKTVKATDTTPSPNPNDLPTPPHISLTAPVAMLDGNVDFTLNISPYKPNIEYNISYIFDTSASMDSGELQIAKNAYTDLTNYFINSGLAENINFGVVKFSRNATLYKDLTASQAISTIQGLTSSPASEGTKYNDGLYQGLNFFSQSPLKNTTNIAYFVSDGRSQTNFADPNDVSYVNDAMNLRRVSNVQSFGIYDPTDPAGVTSSQINFVDSNNGVLVNNINDLSTELQKSGLAGKVSQVNILVDGVVVDTIQPSELIDSPLGLTYEGSVEDLDVSADAENVITAEVVFSDNTATTSVDYTVTAEQGKLTDGSGNPIDESGNTTGDEDPFKKIRNGGDGNDEITLGYADKGASAGAGGDYIAGNKRDNTLDGGVGNDTIKGNGGNDTIITGAGTNKVDGGEGIDTAVYSDVVYQGNTSIFLRQAADTVSYNNTDTLTDVEFIQFSDVRIDAKTRQVVPELQVAEASITEGDSGTKNAQVTFNLSTPAPVNVVFDYSTTDVEAVAVTDYLAASGQVTIPAGQTSATVNLTVNGDVIYEGNETFGLKLSGITGATFPKHETEYNAVVQITNDDPVNYAPYSLGIPDTTVTPGAPNRSINLGEVFQDIEDTTLTYSLQSNTNPAIFDAVTIDQAQKTLLLDYQANSPGVAEVTVRAADSQGFYVDASFTVTAVSATVNNDTLAGSAGNDYLDGDAGNDNISGLAGDDTLSGGAGVDTLIGGTGNDAYVIDTTTDTITENASEGNDTVASSVTYTLGATSNLENITLTGGNAINATGNALNNALEGNSANNSLSGDAGNDTLAGGAGIDSLIGGIGNDLYTVDTAIDTITENQGEGTDTVTSSVTYTLGTSPNLENITLTGGNAINATGNATGNVLEGNSANNNLTGDAGDDTFSGGAGVDTMIGGIGNDLYTVDTATDTITENQSEGTDTVSSSVTFTLGTNLDNLTLTGTSAINGIGNTLNNVLTGNSASNTLIGNTGNDTVTGGAGDDTMTGGYGNDLLTGDTGNDAMAGGAANDTYVVDSIGDVVNETSTTATEIDTVQSSITYSLGSNLENLTLIGSSTTEGYGNTLSNNITGNTANNKLIGNTGNDTVKGGLGDDLLTGGYGSDSLIGEGGNDTLAGGAANDTYVVDSIGDVVSETSTLATEIDSVQSSLSYILGSNLENLTLTGTSAINGTGNALNNTIIGNTGHNQIDGGIGDDALTGNTGNDTVTGGVGNDTMSGGYGSDLLTGGAGNDSLTGGAASDRFVYDTNAVFTASAVGIDQITDFVSGTDKIVLDKTTFTALGSVVGSGFNLATEFAVVGSDAGAATVDALIVYSSETDNLFYNQNGVTAGFGSGAQLATLTGISTLAASDFVLQA